MANFDSQIQALAGTASQSEMDDWAADAVVDITGAEAKAIEVCGHINMTSTEGDLLTGSVVTKSNIGLVLSPHPGATSIYVAGVYRFNPADTSTGSDATDGLDFYFGFKS